MAVSSLAHFSWAADSANSRGFTLRSLAGAGQSVENHFIQVIFYANMIEELRADFLGQGNYGANLLAKPFQLDLTFPTTTEVDRKPQFEPLWKEDSVNGHYSLKMSSILSLNNTATLSEEWEVTLSSSSRQVNILINGKVLNDYYVHSAAYSVYVNNPSIYGLFEHGSFQMMNKQSACLGSNQSLVRSYFMGNGGALDVIFDDLDNVSRQNVFVSTTGKYYKASVQHVLTNNYPTMNTSMELAWNSNCWTTAEPVILYAGTTWSLSVALFPNNYDFPVYPVRNYTTTDRNMNFLDLASTLTAIYGSPMGCIQSYYELHDGMIAPTIAHPNIGYYPKTNFFDPDNFISLSSMIYSQDTYLLEEVRKILKKTGDTMCGIGSLQNPVFCNSETFVKSEVKTTKTEKTVKSETVTDNNNNNEYDHHKEREYTTKKTKSTNHYGQIMHHFNTLSPDYQSIAGSIQLGPNIFWTLTVLKYIAVTQNETFAAEMLPYIELSTQFLLSLYDEEVHLINAPGPLWIDVFVRENYTTDSNAMMIPYLQEVADFYDYKSYKPDEANRFRTIAKEITSGINTYLWDQEDNDHFITQMNLDLTTTRDFIDYDSNLIAVAFGVLDNDVDKVKSVFARIDSNPFAHARATWVSEKEYTGEPSDCYSGPVGNGLCGDSNMTMARIGWVDSLARKRFNDSTTYQKLLLEPLQQDLKTNVWLTERYDQNGNAIRTPYYFEYASFVSIMLHEVSYGIEVKLLTVTINPLIYTEGFDYQLGDIKVFYHPKTSIQLSFPGNDQTSTHYEKMTILHHLMPNHYYNIVHSCVPGYSNWVQANAEGVLQFPTIFWTGCVISLVPMV
jgi:hypothetical protein